MLSMMVPLGATATRVCVCTCVHGPVCVHAGVCLHMDLCVHAHGPVCVCSLAGLKGKALCSLVSGEPGDQPIIELQDGCRGLGVGVGVGLGEQGSCPRAAQPYPAHMVIRVSVLPHLSHTLGCVCRARSLWGAGLRGCPCPQAGRECPQARFWSQLPSCSSEPQSSSRAQGRAPAADRKPRRLSASVMGLILYSLQET